MKSIKSVTFLLVLSLILFIFNCTNSTAPQEPQDINPTEISGVIAGTLAVDSSPYLVTGDLTVEYDTRLVIEGNTWFWFAPGTQLIVNGTLLAQGHRGGPIFFTDSTSNWKGIKFQTAQDISTLDYCVIENVKTFNNHTNGFGAVDVENSKVRIYHTIFRDNYTYAGGGISMDNALVSVQNSIFMDNQTVLFGGAIYSEQSSLTAINNTFYHNSAVNYGGGIATSSGDSLIAQNNIFYKNASKSLVNDFYGSSIYTNTDFNFTGTAENPPGFASLLDFRLLPRSVCIDAGNPAEKYNDPDGTRNDQGAYGGPLGDWHINYPIAKISTTQ